MKIGFFSESRADQAARAVFTEGILGAAPEPINIDLEGRGWGSVRSALDGVIRGVHYNSDAEGLVVCVDCDDSDLHSAEHDKPDSPVDRCRYRQLRKIVLRARNQLKPVTGKHFLKVAIGVTVPSIEAWYLVDRNHQVGEAAWNAGCAANKRPLTRPQLKQELNGTDQPSLELETEHAVREARRIIAKL